MRILFEMDKKDYVPNGSVFSRPSARAVIIKDGKIAMVYSKKYNYYKFPGGGIEVDECMEDSLIREVLEETGLDIQNPRLCGIKQFPIENGRYIVFLFHTDEFLGEVTSSEEGEMVWVKKSDLPKVNAVNDLLPLLQVMKDDNLTEFQYVIENGKWNMIIK